jgi:hypothetical protein
MKYEIKNKGSREVAVQGIGILETVAPNTTRVIDTPGELPAAKLSILRGRGCFVEQADDDAEVTPFYIAGTDPAKADEEMTDAQKLKAAQATCDELEIAYTDKTKLATLEKRIAEEHGKREDAAAKAAEAAEAAKQVEAAEAAKVLADAEAAKEDGTNEPDNGSEKEGAK